MRLAAIQTDFLHFLRDQPGNIASIVAPGGKLGVAKRLSIYHHAYRARLVEVLQDVFERTWAYLGDERFEGSAKAFIDGHPSSTPTLQSFGAAFPGWLVREFPDDGDIADLATIDWLMRNAFDGPDAEAIALQDLSALTTEDWATVGFVFHPTLCIAPIRFNAASLWEALDAGIPPPPATLLDSPTWLLVWRKELQPHFITINAIEVAAIGALRGGATFAAACEKIDAQFPGADVATQLGVALRRWIDDKLLVRTCFPEPGQCVRQSQR